MKTDTQTILESEKEQLFKLQKIVKHTIIEEKLIVKNLLHQPKEILTKRQTIFDEVATF